jgi:lipoate-protein ligase A
VVQRNRSFVLVDPPLSGAANMAIDQDLLNCAEASDYPVTFLRLYAWERPTVSIGYNQRPEQSFDWDYCHLHAVPVVRRPTGGRAVLHAGELTYAVASSDPGLYPLDSVDRTYLALAKTLQSGLARLGIDAELAIGSREPAPERTAGVKPPCFASASRHELLVHGRKVVGSAQRRLRRSFLQHGSIPLRLNTRFTAAVLGVSEELILRTTTSVSDAAGRDVLFEEVAEALAEAFRENWATAGSPAR